MSYLDAIARVGHNPSNANPNTVTGTHLLGFNRESLRSFCEFVDGQSELRWMGLDTWLRNLIPQGLVKIASRLAHPRRHELEKRR